MSVATLPHPALRWDGRRLSILDQTRLPRAEVWLTLEGAADTARAIRRLAVRGAPLIGGAPPPPGHPPPGRARRPADRGPRRLRAGDGSGAPAQPRHPGGGLGAPALS